MNQYRTHTCDDLKTEDIGKEVKLAGWVHNKRDHGGVLFIDLRDHYGITQVVIHPDSHFIKEAAHFHKETVISFQGIVDARAEENINPKLNTGNIELNAQTYEILATCSGLPFSVYPEEQAPEETRLKYRYLDLRKESLHQNIILRSRVIKEIRNKMDELGFMEIQTPILTASSPEGARDYLVPSRLHPGTFYALPQAPQQYKQLLMASGFDRYFQIAPCFRDEDARATRSPGEFYQLDMEMAFASQDEIFSVIEEVLGHIFKKFSDAAIPEIPFPRITYSESMLKYGCDKPDLRIPLEIKDCSGVFKGSDFKAFAKVVENGGVVRCISVKDMGNKPRSFYEKMIEFSQSIGSKGLAYMNWTDEGIKSPIAKFISSEGLEKLTEIGECSEGDAMFFICHKEKEAVRIAGEIRVKLGEELDMVEKDVFKFCWIVDYPMYEMEEGTNKIIFSHNPFSMPQGGMDALTTKNPLEILAYQYDVVCNGIELSSGAIRNHKPEVMYKAFEIAGYDPKVIDENFPAMIEAFKIGAPPHGGIAPGIDRMIMLLADEANLREVIAFPMNQKAQDVMMNAPRAASPRQLKELHLKLDVKKTPPESL